MRARCSTNWATGAVIYGTGMLSCGKLNKGLNVQAFIFAISLRGAQNYDDQVTFVMDHLRQLWRDQQFFFVPALFKKRKLTLDCKRIVILIVKSHLQFGCPEVVVYEIRCWWNPLGRRKNPSPRWARTFLSSQWVSSAIYFISIILTFAHSEVVG